MVAGVRGREGLLPPAVPGHRGQHQARVRPAGAIRSTEQGCFYDKPARIGSYPFLT